MQNLHNYLPKDLVNIIEEYSKDRSQYDEVLTELLISSLYYKMMIPKIIELHGIQNMWKKTYSWHYFADRAWKKQMLEWKREEQMTWCQDCEQELRKSSVFRHNKSKKHICNVKIKILLRKERKKKGISYLMKPLRNRVG